MLSDFLPPEFLRVAFHGKSVVRKMKAEKDAAQPN
jgi:hypothetical protein